MNVEKSKFPRILLLIYREGRLTSFHFAPCKNEAQLTAKLNNNNNNKKKMLHAVLIRYRLFHFGPARSPLVELGDLFFFLFSSSRL
jgi:hypothetical protein